MGGTIEASPMQPWPSAGSKTNAILQMPAFRAFPDHQQFASKTSLTKAAVAPRPRASLPHRGSGAAAALATTDEAAVTGDGSPWPLGHPERARLLRYYGAQVRAVASASR